MSYNLDDLKSKLDGELYSDSLRTQMLSTDASIFKIVPLGVVYPKTTPDIQATLTFARENNLTVHSRGAGSGVTGASLGSGIILDFTKFMNRLIEVNEKEKYFICEPGYKMGELEVALSNTTLFFPPDPSSGEFATFGGMFGTNASGARSVKYGNIGDYVADASIILSTGEEIWFSQVFDTPYEDLPDNLKKLHDLYTFNKSKIESAYPSIKYNSTGYNLRRLVQDVKNGEKQDARLFLKDLFAGSEGTIGVTNRIKFRLMEKPTHEQTVVAAFTDMVHAVEAVQKILPMDPASVEILEKSVLNLTVEHDKSLEEFVPEGTDNIVLIDFDSFDSATCLENARIVFDMLESNEFVKYVLNVETNEQKEKFRYLRKASGPICFKLKGKRKTLGLIEDAAVPTDKLDKYFQGLYDIMGSKNVNFVSFGHISKGLMHTRPLLDMKDEADIKLMKIIADEFFELVFSLGGAISGEHGDGRLRTCYVKRQYPEIYPLLLEVKHILDPHGMLNPEIITGDDETLVQKNLRYGADYKTIPFEGKFLKWDDGIISEIEKCHGCSKCTTVTNATRMCPVYKFTRDEAATPKAKSNILKALISGAIDDQMLYEQAFRNVIDRCIGCGSCSADCPSNINTPKLVAEARAIYAKRFGVPLSSRLLTSAGTVGHHARKTPGIMKKMMNLKPAKKISGMLSCVAPERDIPDFAEKSLFDQVKSIEGDGDLKVLYFTGCYAGYLRPEIGVAAVEVMKKMGIKVYIPEQNCCGLPMLSKGMVDEGKKQIHNNIKKWSSLLEEVDHIVVTCSSCGFALNKEWSWMLDKETADKVSKKIIHISTLLDRQLKATDLKHGLKHGLKSDPESGIKKGDLNLCYHTPCHMKLQDDSTSSIRILSRIEGVTITDLKSNCCGMAGSWGMAEKNYELSSKIGSDLVSRFDMEDCSIGVTDCPTCQLQMEHLTGKQIKHPVEILLDCLK